jgi:5-(aminomethyl)-3-furanmethanol phosphate kinase
VPIGPIKEYGMKPDHPPAHGSSLRPWVVKIDDSPPDWDALATWLELLSRPDHRIPIIVVPGEGRFEDTVREAQDTWRFSDRIARKMAFLAMEQFGLMLHGICPALHLALDELRLRALVRARLPAIWLPTEVDRNHPDLAECSDLASDSLAAWLAAEVGAAALVLVKADPCPCGVGDAAALAREGLVDAAFPAWQARFNGRTWCIHRDHHALMRGALAGRGLPEMRLGRGSGEPCAVELT